MRRSNITVTAATILVSVLISCLCYFLIENHRNISGNASTCSEKLVIDTDAGADDAAAILLVLSAWARHDSNFEVVAITCTYGNTAESNVRRNVLKTITIANASYIPVYGGAQKPLTNNFTSDDYFGKDGFGDFVMNEEVTATVNESYHAAIVLVNLARQYPKQLNILALGPLTNIALAISLDANFTSNVKRFYIMGGSVAGLGNLSPGIEYNFGADPRWRNEKLGRIGSNIVQFLNRAEKKSLNATSTWRPADAMLAAVMIWRELINESIVVNASPVTDGEAKGALLIDYGNTNGKPKNVRIVLKLNVDAFMEKIVHYFE